MEQVKQIVQALISGIDKKSCIVNKWVHNKEKVEEFGYKHNSTLEASYEIQNYATHTHHLNGTTLTLNTSLLGSIEFELKDVLTADELNTFTDALDARYNVLRIQSLDATLEQLTNI